MGRAQAPAIMPGSARQSRSQEPSGSAQNHGEESPDFRPGRLTLDCRPGCGACCIAPSISSLDKPAGVPCRHLTEDLRCSLFGQPQRPACCSGLQPSEEMCGSTQEYAIYWLTQLEEATRPG